MSKRIKVGDLPEFDAAPYLDSEALYKALRPRSAARFDTVRRVCASLGVRLVVQPAHP